MHSRRQVNLLLSLGTMLLTAKSCPGSHLQKATQACSDCLRIIENGVVRLALTRQDLDSALEAETISIFDPEYGRQKRYRGYKLVEILALAFNDPRMLKGAYFIFRSKDGYSVSAKHNTIQQPGGYIAITDLDANGWEPLPMEGAPVPAPFYLVWQLPAQTIENGYPWPWQLVEIELTY